MPRKEAMVLGALATLGHTRQPQKRHQDSPAAPSSVLGVRGWAPRHEGNFRNPIEGGRPHSHKIRASKDSHLYRDSHQSLLPSAPPPLGPKRQHEVGEIDLVSALLLTYYMILRKVLSLFPHNEI